MLVKHAGHIQSFESEVRDLSKPDQELLVDALTLQEDVNVNDDAAISDDDATADDDNDQVLR